MRFAHSQNETKMVTISYDQLVEAVNHGIISREQLERLVAFVSELAPDTNVLSLANVLNCIGVSVMLLAMLTSFAWFPSPYSHRDHIPGIIAVQAVYAAIIAYVS